MKKLILNLSIVTFSSMMLFSSCKDCLDCYGTVTTNIDSIARLIDGQGNVSYPSYYDSTFYGKTIGEFCDGDDPNWKDLDGTETVIIISSGDSITGAQILTSTTKWECN
tara:strand:- start:2005 stop:2331 length:327 start_codon:yes stop_codon:yes gene_type:complete